MSYGAVASSNPSRPRRSAQHGRVRRLIEAFRDRLLPSRRFALRRLAHVALAAVNGGDDEVAVGDGVAATHQAEAQNGVASNGGSNGNGHKSHADTPADFRDVWTTSWDPFSDRRGELDALEHRRPKWVTALDTADGGRPSDWYIGPVGPTLPDVIYASDAEFAEFAKLAEMSAFDSGKDRLIRQRLVALAHGQELDPDEMSKEETALRHSAERYGKGELPGDPPPES